MLSSSLASIEEALHAVQRYQANPISVTRFRVGILKKPKVEYVKHYYITWRSALTLEIEAVPRKDSTTCW